MELIMICAQCNSADLAKENSAPLSGILISSSRPVQQLAEEFSGAEFEELRVCLPKMKR
jgi:hypothetical protein